MKKSDLLWLLGGALALSKRERRQNPRDSRNEKSDAIEVMESLGLSLYMVEQLRERPYLISNEDMIVAALLSTSWFYLGTDEDGEDHYLINLTPHEINFVRELPLRKNPNLSRDYVLANFVYQKKRPTRPLGHNKKSWLAQYPKPLYRGSLIPQERNKRYIIVDGQLITAKQREELGLLDLGDEKGKPTRKAKKAQVKDTREFVNVPPSGLYLGHQDVPYPKDRFPTLAGGATVEKPQKQDLILFFQDPLRRGEKRKSDFYAYGAFPSPEVIEAVFPNTYFVISRRSECVEQGLIYPFLLTSKGKGDYLVKDDIQYNRRFYFADMVCETHRK